MAVEISPRKDVPVPLASLRTELPSLVLIHDMLGSEIKEIKPKLSTDAFCMSFLLQIRSYMSDYRTYNSFYKLRQPESS